MTVSLRLGIILLLASCVAANTVRRISCEHQNITLTCEVGEELPTVCHRNRTVNGSVGACPGKADIAFLLDGSGSVSSADFRKMKTFVKHIIGSLVGQGTRFAVVQYASGSNIHFDFSQFNIGNWRNQVDQISKTGGGTRTAAGINRVVTDVFSARGGVRPDAKRFLIVITDGVSGDRSSIPTETSYADRKHIVRFAIGVGAAFSNDAARAELDSIASAPKDMHVFRVTNFNALDGITSKLQDSIIIEGHSLIKVISANYGRTNNYTCVSGRRGSEVTNTKCIQPRTLPEVAKRCDGRTVCSLDASDSVFPDACSRTFKYLDVSYTCIPIIRPRPVLKCGRSKMEVGLDLAQLENAGLDPSSAHLADHSCSPNERGNTTVWYGVERTEGTCGNTLRTNDSHAIYSNSLFVYLSNVTMVTPMKFPFSCYYPLETETSLDVVIKPYLVEGGLRGDGPKARASMSLFRKANYTDPYPAGAVRLPLGSVLYVGVFVVEIERTRFVVVLENCYATHTPNPDDRMRYFLIQNKCPTDRRQVVVTESGSSLRAHFSALLFLFQGNYNDVFLHCSLSLCDKQGSSSCSPMCSGRRRRSTSEYLLPKPLTIGPITWDQE